MSRMAWHLATPQRLEPVGPDRDYSAGVPRRTRREAPGRRHRNTTEYHGGLDLVVGLTTPGVGPDQPRSQPASC